MFRVIPRLPRASRAILSAAMKVIVGIAVLLLVAVSCLADYRWKKWIAARKRERDHSAPPGSYRR